MTDGRLSAFGCDPIQRKEQSTLGRALLGREMSQPWSAPHTSFCCDKTPEEANGNKCIWVSVQGKGSAPGSVNLGAQAVILPLPSPGSTPKDGTTLLHASWQKPLTCV